MLAVDWRKHIRTWMKGDFFASLGVCLDFSKPEEFKAYYESLLKTTLAKYQIETGSRVLKSSQVASIFSERLPAFHNFLADFAAGILSNPGLKTAIFYTTLNTKTLTERATALTPSSEEGDQSGRGGGGKSAQAFENTFEAKVIKKYGRSGFPVEMITPKQFLNELDGYYGIVCAWKYVGLSQAGSQEVLIDGFEGAEVTDAWLELINNNKVSVAFRGDSCNAYLSAADLMTRFVDIRLKNWRMPLDRGPLDKVLASVCKPTDLERTFIKRISNPDLRKIVASEKRKIDVSAYLLHPTIMICKEEETAQERTMFENSPMMSRIYSMAYEVDGSVVFFEPTKHSAYVKKGDKCAFYGPKGRAQFEKLKSMGYEVEPLDLTKA